MSEERASDLARLFNLFEGLATRRPQLNATSKDMDSGYYKHPKAFTPLLQTFSAVGNYEDIKALGAPRSLPLRTRRNTVAVMSHPMIAVDTSEDSTSSDDDGDKDDESLADFPLGNEKYPFTFKHMIHKLYRKDEWVRTVKEVLERSRKDFKPLAESPLFKNPSIEFHAASRAGVGKRRSVLTKGNGSRRLSQAIGHDAKSPFSSLFPDFPPIDDGAQPPSGESLRALKKRCVGVRKSISGNQNVLGSEDGAKKCDKGGTFVFASRISVAEGPEKEIYLNLPFSPPLSPTTSFSSSEYDSVGYGQMASPSNSITSTAPTSPVALQPTAGAKRRVSVDYQQVIRLKGLPNHRPRDKNVDRASWRRSLRTELKKASNEDLQK